MSEIKEFPINELPYQNIDPFALDTINVDFFDGYIQAIGENKYSIKRPGFNAFVELASMAPIQGAYWWSKKNVLAVVSGGKLFTITDTNGTISDLTGDLLPAFGLPTFADNGDYLVVANGGPMIYTDGTTPAQYISSANAPQNVTHVAFLDYWLLANNVGASQINFADFTAAPTTWNALDVFTAESEPDNILAMYVNRRTIVIFGTESLEMWYDDGVTPFSRIDGTITQRGVMGPNATVFANEIGFFFDEKRRFVRLDGQVPTVVSTPYDKFIQDLAIVQDCTMFYMTVSGRNLILINFPSEQTSLVFDMDIGAWYRWSFWDSSLSVRQRFIGNCYAYSPYWNLHILGSFKTSQMFQMSDTVYMDDTEEIKFLKKTGWITHGTQRKSKTCHGLSLRLKSGTGIGTGGNTEPNLLIRWRENGDSEWGNYVFVPLGVQGKTNFKYEIRNLGSYYARQWEFSMTDNIPFTIAEAQEEITYNDF